MIMDNHKISEKLQGGVGCKMISPHHSHPTNGVSSSDSYSYHYNSNAGKETPANDSEYYSAPVWKQFGGRL